MIFEGLHADDVVGLEPHDRDLVLLDEPRPLGVFVARLPVDKADQMC